MEQRRTLPIKGDELDSLKPGDHVFTADFACDVGEEPDFDVKEFEIKKVFKSTIEDNQVTTHVEMVDIRFPKSIIKHNLADGFFLSEKAACDGLLETLEYLYTKAKEVHAKRFAAD